MMGNLKSGRCRGVMLVLGLVPGFFLMEHVGAGGFQVAEGCGGGNAVAPAPRVTIERDLTTTKLGVATDGFIVLRTQQLFDAADVSVVVTDEQGKPVAGAVKSVQDGNGGAHLTWSAEKALPIGAKIKVAVGLTQGNVAATATDTAELEVVGEPTQLAADGLAFGDWLDFGHGVGDQVTCSTRSCYAQSLMVPSAEEVLHAVRAKWAGPTSVNGYVLWEVKLDLADEQKAIQYPLAQVASTTLPEPLEVGVVPFPLATKKYCATLLVKDLRTGKEMRSEHCEDMPGKSTGTERDYPLVQCGEPPSPALTEAWCKLHPESTLPVCTGIMDRVDPVPIEGVAGGTSDAGDGATKPPVKMPVAEDGEHTSSGCSVALGRRTGGGLAFALGFVAAALSFARRRRNG